jgi:hypothetical protein
MRSRLGWLSAGFVVAAVLAAAGYCVWTAFIRPPNYAEFKQNQFQQEGLEVYSDWNSVDTDDLIKTNSLKYVVTGMHEYKVRPNPNVKGSEQALQAMWRKYTKHPERVPPEVLLIREELGFQGRGKGYHGSGWYWTKRELVE